MLGPRPLGLPALPFPLRGHGKIPDGFQELRNELVGVGVRLLHGGAGLVPFQGRGDPAFEPIGGITQDGHGFAELIWRKRVIEARRLDAAASEVQEENQSAAPMDVDLALPRAVIGQGREIQRQSTRDCPCAQTYAAIAQDLHAAELPVGTPRHVHPPLLSLAALSARCCAAFLAARVRAPGDRQSSSELPQTSVSLTSSSPHTYEQRSIAGGALSGLNPPFPPSPRNSQGGSPGGCPPPGRGFG